MNRGREECLGGEAGVEGGLHRHKWFSLAS